ncbi:hypothetical protein CSPX01_14423 [Colletotrichum filicis]|nr:hypothetical protein CSPX01_14423 [Colletotrichum filicis]
MQIITALTKRPPSYLTLGGGGIFHSLTRGGGGTGSSRPVDTAPPGTLVPCRDRLRRPTFPTNTHRLWHRHYILAWTIRHLQPSLLRANAGYVASTPDLVAGQMAQGTPECRGPAIEASPLAKPSCHLDLCFYFRHPLTTDVAFSSSLKLFRGFAITRYASLGAPGQCRIHKLDILAISPATSTPTTTIVRHFQSLRDQQPPSRSTKKHVKGVWPHPSCGVGLNGIVPVLTGAAPRSECPRLLFHTLSG